MLLITALKYELSSLNTNHIGEKSSKVEGADKYKERGREKQLRKKGATDEKEKEGGGNRRERKEKQFF